MGSGSAGGGSEEDKGKKEAKGSDQEGQARNEGSEEEAKSRLSYRGSPRNKLRRSSGNGEDGAGPSSRSEAFAASAAAGAAAGGAAAAAGAADSERAAKRAKVDLKSLLDSSVGILEEGGEEGVDGRRSEGEEAAAAGLAAHASHALTLSPGDQGEAKPTASKQPVKAGLASTAAAAAAAMAGKLYGPGRPSDDDRVGANKCIRTVEFVRLIEQALRSLGYHRAAAELEAESQVPLEAVAVGALREAVLQGQWDASMEVLRSLNVPSDALRHAEFLLQQQRFLELLEEAAGGQQENDDAAMAAAVSAAAVNGGGTAGKTSAAADPAAAALMVLRKRLTPLCGGAGGRSRRGRGGGFVSGLALSEYSSLSGAGLGGSEGLAAAAGDLSVSDFSSSLKKSLSIPPLIPASTSSLVDPEADSLQQQKRMLQQQRRRRLHELAACLMCSSRDDLLQRARWQGRGGASRHAVLRELQALLPPALVLPDRRLEALVEQTLMRQQAECAFHNHSEDALSLFEDHSCGRDNIPSVTTQVLEEHEDEVWCVQFSHDGKRLASASKDRRAIIWEVEDEFTSRVQHVLVGHKGTLSFVAWSPDDSMLVSCGSDNLVKLWDTRTGACLHTLSKHTDSVTACAWFPCGRRFVSGGIDKSLHVWDVDGNEVSLFGSCSSSSVDEQQQQLSSSSRLGPSGSGSMVKWPSGSVPRINDLAISRDGKRMVSICNEREIIVVALNDGTTHSVTEEKCITSLSMSLDSRSILVNLSSGFIHLWDLDTICSGSSSSSSRSSSNEARSSRSASAPAATATTAARSTAAAGAAANQSVEAAPSTMGGSRFASAAGRAAAVAAAAAAAAAAQGVNPIPTFGTAGSERAWWQQPHHPYHYHYPHYHSSGYFQYQQAVAAAAVATAAAAEQQPPSSPLVQRSEHEPRPSFKYKGQVQGRFVIRSCFGGSHQLFIVSGSEDSQVYMWHRHTGEVLHVLSGHAGTVNAVSWPASRPYMFASASDDRTIRIWGLPRAAAAAAVAKAKAERTGATAHRSRGLAV